MSNRVRTPKRDSTVTYDRTVAQARQQPVVRPRSRHRRPRIRTARLRPEAMRRGWRWASGTLSLTIGIVLLIVLTSKQFYVDQIEVGGLRTMPAEEVFAESGVAGYHIFWIDADKVAEAVASSPSIATASARVYWPARVVVQVNEREPALVWEQEGKRYWVDVRGNLMPQRQDLPNLIRILSESPAVPVGCPGTDCPGKDIAGRVSVEQDVIEGALQLKTLRPDIELLYYDAESGLSFDEDGGWRAYFGVGTQMRQKMLIYEAIVANLQARGVQPTYLDVSNPEAPVYGVPVISG